MEIKKLSRTHLESLSSQDLILLADEYSIDVPDNLSRRFLIGELLDISEEFENEAGGKMQEFELLDSSEKEKAPVSLRRSAKGIFSLSSELPSSFNETQIDVVLRNPVWAFVYWDIKGTDLARVKSIFLRILYFKEKDSEKPFDSFDLSVSLEVREQFVMLSHADGCNFARIDLAAKLKDESEDVLAYSGRFELFSGSDYLFSARPGREVNLPRIMELSGMKNALKRHYESHRETFAN